MAQNNHVQMSTPPSPTGTATGPHEHKAGKGPYSHVDIEQSTKHDDGAGPAFLPKRGEVAEPSRNFTFLSIGKS